MHYFKFDVEKWAYSTRHLLPEEEGVYLRLTLCYYDTEKPIPLDLTPVLRRLLLLPYKEIVARILDEFFTQTPDGWEKRKCEDNIAIFHAKAATARKNGAKGGRPKHKKTPKTTQKEPSGNPEETQRVPRGNPEHNLITNDKLLITNDKLLMINDKLKEPNTRGRMKRPVPAEVQDYLNELKETRFTGEQFCDSNEAKGWVVGKNKTPMKKWKAVVRTWRTFRDQDDQPQTDFGEGGI